MDGPDAPLRWRFASRYLDDAQRQELQDRRSSWRWRSEWPTWTVVVAVYAGWFGVALNARTLGLAPTVALLAVLSCWYMSLQHELMHGHPTRWPLVNMLFSLAPLAVWFPYEVYRDSHLRHHDDAHLTEPGRDPESYYVAPEQWANAGAVLRAALAARTTFAGRVLIGPWFSIAASWWEATQAVAERRWRIVAGWAVHLVALAALAHWLEIRLRHSAAGVRVRRGIRIARAVSALVSGASRGGAHERTHGRPRGRMALAAAVSEQ